MAKGRLEILIDKPEFQGIFDVKKDRQKIRNITNPGCYCFLNSHQKEIYVGKTKQTMANTGRPVGQRVLEQIDTNTHRSSFEKVLIWTFDDDDEGWYSRDIFEIELCRQRQPVFNKDFRYYDYKQFWDEEEGDYVIKEINENEI